MIIGATSLGGWVGKELAKRGVKPVCEDVRKFGDMFAMIRYNKVDVVIHNAAMTNVEECEKNPTDAFSVNVGGTTAVVDVCSGYGIPLIYLSTDHVFNGKPKNYLPNEKTKPDPVNIYGFTKYAGEVIVPSSTARTVIVRSSKLINGDWLASRGLIDLESGMPLDAPTFIKRGFMHISDFVDALFRIIDTMNKFNDLHETFHVSSLIPISYLTFWNTVQSEYGSIDESLIKARDIQYTNFAPVPYYGGLDISKAVKSKILDFTVTSYNYAIKKSLEEYRAKIKLIN